MGRAPFVARGRRPVTDRPLTDADVEREIDQLNYAPSEAEMDGLR